jgi:hypothetical protein
MCVHRQPFFFFILCHCDLEFRLCSDIHVNYNVKLKLESSNFHNKLS